MFLQLSVDKNRRLILALLPITYVITSFTREYDILLLITSVSFAIFLINILIVFYVGFKFRFLLLSTLFCGAWLSLGFLLSFAQSPNLNSSLFSLIFSGVVRQAVVDTGSYSLAFAYSFFFLLFLDLFSGSGYVRQAESRFYRIFFSPKFGIHFNSYSAFAQALLFSLSVFFIWIATLGLFRIRSINNDSFSSSLPWWYPLLTLLLNLFPTLIILSLFPSQRFKPLPFLIATLGFFTGLYYVALEGRLALIAYFTQLITIPFVLSVVSLPKKFNLKTLVALSVVVSLFPLLTSATTFLHYIRWHSIDINPFTLFGLFQEFLASNQFNDSSQMASENLLSRPLVLWPLAAVIDMDLKGLNLGYLYFQDITNSFFNSLPNPIFQGKQYLLLQENLLYFFFPFSTVDTVDSPHLYAYASFSLLGLIVYPFALSLFYVLSISITTFLAERLYSGLRILSLLILFATLVSFSVDSFGELSTTAIIRQFQMPIISAFVLLILSPFIQLSRPST